MSEKPNTKTVVIEVLDQVGQVVVYLETTRPEWSFEQYCRNRVTPGWSWRLKLSTGA